MRLTVGGHSATAWNTPASSTQPCCLRPCRLSVRTALFGQFGSNEMVTGLAAMIACRAADSWGDFTTLASDSSGVIPMAIPFSRRKKRPPGALPLGVAGLSPQQAWGPLLHSFYDQCSDHGWGAPGKQFGDVSGVIQATMMGAIERQTHHLQGSGHPHLLDFFGLGKLALEVHMTERGQG